MFPHERRLLEWHSEVMVQHETLGCMEKVAMFISGEIYGICLIILC